MITINDLQYETDLEFTLYYDNEDGISCSADVAVSNYDYNGETYRAVSINSDKSIEDFHDEVIEVINNEYTDLITEYLNERYAEEQVYRRII